MSTWSLLLISARYFSYIHSQCHTRVLLVATTRVTFYQPNKIPAIALVKIQNIQGVSEKWNVTPISTSAHNNRRSNFNNLPLCAFLELVLGTFLTAQPLLTPLTAYLGVLDISLASLTALWHPWQLPGILDSSLASLTALWHHQTATLRSLYPVTDEIQ